MIELGLTSRLDGGFSSRSRRISRRRNRAAVTRWRSSATPTYWPFTGCCGTTRRRSAIISRPVVTTKLSAAGPSIKWPLCWPIWDRLSTNLLIHSTSHINSFITTFDNITKLFLFLLLLLPLFL